VTIDDGIMVASHHEFETWLATKSHLERDVWTIIFDKASKKQTVRLDELIESGLCWGWVDHLSRKIDEERYGVRFVPRRPGSNWSPRNRATACRLIAASRMQPVGSKALPPDLVCPE